MTTPPVNKAVDPKWPEDLPHEEGRFFSISVGNSSMIWAIHNTRKFRYDKGSMWRTATISPEAVKEVGNVQTLRNYIPSFLFEDFFGRNADEELITVEDMYRRAAVRRVPETPIYVVSTNSENLSGLEHMFAGLPFRLYRMQASDFFEQEKGAYEGIGIDRLAAARGAMERVGLPVLVIDGGTATTYTAVDASGNVRGGGISPGIELKLLALHQGTGALPLVDFARASDIIKEFRENEAKMSIFAQSTEHAMLGSVLHETVSNLATIVKQWRSIEMPLLSKAKLPAGVTLNRDLNVVICGGDGPLIRDLMDPEKSVIDLPASVRPDPSGFFYCKELVGLGVRAKLLEFEMSSDKEDQLRRLVRGQRVVRTLGEKQLRGSINEVRVVDESLEHDKYLVRYDNGEQELLGPKDIYAGLKQYASAGEAFVYSEDAHLKRSESKKMDADRASDELAESLESLKDKRNPNFKSAWRKRPVTPTIEAEPPAKKPRDEPTESNDSAPHKGTATKPAKKMHKAPEVPSIKQLKATPTSYVGRRVANYFPQGLFYGWVVDFTPKESPENQEGKDLFSILYDDDDPEVESYQKVVRYLKYYSTNKHGDRNPPDFAARAQKWIEVLLEESNK